MIPVRYSPEDPGARFAGYWADVRTGKQILEEVQVKAMTRWVEYLFPVGQQIQKLPLNFFLEIFDDYLFRGALRKGKCIARWTDCFPDRKGQTTIITSPNTEHA